FAEVPPADGVAAGQPVTGAEDSASQSPPSGISPARIRPAAGSFRELWQVALPLILSSGSISLLHFMDRVFLTWHSKFDLAAVTPAGMLHWTFMSVAIGTITYVNTFVAQYEGAGRRDRVVSAVWQGVFLSLGAGLLFMIVTPLTPVLFGLIGHQPEVQVREIAYFSVFCVGAVPITVSAALSCFFSGRGETRTVMYVNFAVVAVNGVLDAVLIFGFGPIPEMGIRGAAIATVLASTCGLVLYGLLMARAARLEGWPVWEQCRICLPLLRRLLRYGLPTGFQMLADIAGISMFIFMVGLLGTDELAATNLAFNLNTLAFIPMMGIGTAVMTLVGRRIGDGRPEIAVRTTWMACGLGSVYMLSFAAIYLLFPRQLLYLYSVNCPAEEFAPVCDTAVVLLRFVALYSFFDGLAIVFGSAVRGAGDTRFSLIFTSLTAWLVMVVPTWIAWRFYEGSLAISWSACAAYIVLLGIGFLIRFQMGQWKQMRVIEDDPSENQGTPGPIMADSSPADSSVPGPAGIPTPAVVSSISPEPEAAGGLLC
ncbi:MAG: MATE family efflux transporter, partial [Planctomycetaceae bacterium]|nr:MATE family efflux transporter [Planctomycetaceae bacterium]